MQEPHLICLPALIYIRHPRCVGNIWGGAAPCQGGQSLDPTSPCPWILTAPSPSSDIRNISLPGWCISVVLALTHFIPEHNGIKSYTRKTYLGCFQAVYISDACVVSSTERIRINAFLVDTVLIFQAKLRSRTPVSAAVCLLSS